MVGKPTSWGKIVGLLGVALLVGASAVALADDAPAPDGGAKLSGLVGMISNYIADVKQLLLRSQRESTALKTSCIEDKLNQLQLKKTTAQEYASGFAKADPAGQQKMLDDAVVLEIYSAALVRDARNCKDAVSTQVRLEVQYGNTQAPPPSAPTFEPLPTVSYSRPPLATPF
jgi:hypothetical protein